MLLLDGFSTSMVNVVGWKHTDSTTVEWIGGRSVIRVFRAKVKMEGNRAPFVPGAQAPILLATKESLASSG